jgi:hypothetical protein
MFKRFLVLALALAFVSSVNAGICGPGGCPDASQYTIMIVSDSGMERDGINDADDQTKALGGKFVDESLVLFLENAGFNVDTSGMGGRYRRQGKDDQYNEPLNWWDPADTSGRKAALEAADLIIVSKFASSGCYARNENPGALSTTVAWNQLAVPILSQNAHLIRGQGAAYGGGSTKWGWTNGNNGRDHQGNLATDMAPVPVSHPAYGWIDPTQLFDWSGNPGNAARDTGGGSGDGREPDLCVGDWAPGTTILGYLENDPSVWGEAWPGGKTYGTEEYQDHAILALVPGGVDLDAFNSNGNTTPGQDVYGVLGANRGFFGIWSYDGSPDYYWGMDLTSCYKALFLNTVCEMVPEPATIALLGLGGLALLRKRR